MGTLFDDVEAAFSRFGWESALEVALLGLAIFWVLRLLRGTTAMPVVRGVAIVVVAVVVVGRIVDSAVLHWLVNHVLPVLVLFVLIIFQPEFRRALERVGRAGFRSWLAGGRHGSYDDLIAVVAQTAERLAQRRTGALIVLERETGLDDVVRTGVPVDAVPSSALLEGLFHPQTPLHDGAVVVRPGRVVAASCLLPLSSEDAARDNNLGMRHRAALGITEQTDALTVVVSEETGTISLANHGRLVRPLDRVRLEALLTAALNGSGRPGRRAAARLRA